MDSSEFDPISLEELVDLKDFEVKPYTSIETKRDYVQFVDQKEKMCLIKYETPDQCIQTPIMGSEHHFPSVDPTGEIAVNQLENEKFARCGTLVMYNMKTMEKISEFSHGKVYYYQWISADTLAVVTLKEVFHWSKDGSSVKVFDLLDKLWSKPIIRYLVDDTGNWHLLVTQANFHIMQLFSKKHNKSKILAGQQAACFTNYKKSECGSVVNVLCINTNYFPPPGWRRVIQLEELPEAAHKVRIIELDEDFKLPTLSKVLIPIYPDVDRDTCIGLHASEKYGIIFHVTARGWITLVHVKSGKKFFMCGYLDDLCGGLFSFISGVKGGEAGEGFIRKGVDGRVFKVTLTEEGFESYLKEKLGQKTSEDDI